MSQLKVNSIVPTAGLSGGASGGIIQIKQVVKTDITTGSFSGTDFIDILTVDITPTSSLSKVYVSCVLSVETSGNHNATVLQLRRGTTDILIADASDSRTRCTVGLPFRNVAYKLPVITTCFLDSPSTTSSTTYRLSIKDGNGDGGNYFINRPSSTVTNANNIVGTSSITVMEVSG